MAIDPTLKGDQTTAIVISVVYRSCAIPVAWHIRHADQPGSWSELRRGCSRGRQWDGIKADPGPESGARYGGGGTDPAGGRQEEPWIILTDLAPDQVGPSWYALRFWIELGFKALKSLGWKWDKTRRTDPTRVSRHWLVLGER